MPKIRFRNIATGTTQDADGALPLDATPYGGSAATIRPKAYRQSAAAAAVIPPQNVAPPNIVGAVGVYQTLAHAGDDWIGATSFNYRWLSNGVLVGTAAAYVVQPSDEGNTITMEKQGVTLGATSAWIAATASVFIPTIIAAVVLNNEWSVSEALLDADTRKVFARVDDNPTDGYEFCISIDPVADVTLAPLEVMTAIQAHYELTAATPAAVGSPTNRTVQSVRVAERLIADPTNINTPRWVSEIKTFTASSTPAAPTVALSQGPGDGEIIINLTTKAPDSGRAITSYQYRVDGGAWVSLPGNLEIGPRSISGFIPLASYSIEVRAVNANGAGTATTAARVIAGDFVTEVGATTTLTFAGQQIVIEGSYTVVTHIDGPKCIVSSGPITVQSKSPAIIPTVGAVRNGVMKNPQRGIQAFDSRASQLDATKLGSFPMTLAPGDILLSAVSMPETLNLAVPREGSVDSYDMVYVAAVAPNPNTVAPPAIGWAGRTSVTPGPVIDYMAKVALLPTTYGLTGHAYPDLATISNALRFNPMYAFTTQTSNTAPNAGYERMMPWRWATPAAGYATTSNYGQFVGNRLVDYMWHLAAPLSQVPLESKAKILALVHSFAYQCEQTWEGVNHYPPVDGAHTMIHQGPFGLMYWLTNNNAGLDAMRTRFGGNWGQYFYLTEEMVPEWFQPWGDPDDVNSQFTLNYPSTSFRRRIITADPVLKQVTIKSLSQYGSGGRFGASTKQRLVGLYLTKEVDGESAKILSSGGDWASGTTNTEIIQLETWPAVGFAVGDVVTSNVDWTPAVGDAEWRITPGPNRYNPSAGMSYRSQTDVLPAIAFLRLLGLHRDDWQSVWQYCLRTELPSNPSAGNDYPPCRDAGTLGSKLWVLYQDAIKAVAQPFMSGGPVASPFYPAVPDVNIMVEGAALKFPEGNGSFGNEDAGLKIYKGVLYQPEPAVGLAASTVPQAFFAIVRLPNDKKFTDSALGIFGNSGTGGNRIRLNFTGGDAGVTGNRYKFGGYAFGNGGTSATTYSADWTEDTALVVMKCNGASVWSVDWYSLETGIKYEDPTPVTAATAASAGGLTGTSFGVGGNFQDSTAYTSNTSRHWPGEIEAIGIVRRDVSDAEWTSIALGADIVTVLAAGNPANITYLKEYDPTVTTLVKPATGTGDISVDPIPVGAGVDPVAIPASRLLPGSTIRRQSTNTYFTIKLLSEGWVYGLKAGEVTRLVPFSGTAAGYTGNVQVRVYNSLTGDVVRDWTVVGAISGNTWSGNLELPKGNGWWFAEARVANNPSVKAFRRTEFSVGYKFLILGQSQVSIGVGNAISTPLDSPQTYSIANSQGASYPRLCTIGTSSFRGAGSGPLNSWHWFGNQFRKFDPSTPFMVIVDAVNGTSMTTLYDTPSSLRSWDMLQFKLDTWGNDVTSVVHQWATSDGGTTSSTGTTNTTVYKERLDALFYGTGAAAGANNLAAAMPNAVFTMSPTTRYTENSPGGFSVGQHNRARTQVCEWAYANNATVGPPVSDIRIENAGGPHQSSIDPMGSNVMMTRFAIAFARSLGLDVSKNAYFTTAAFNTGKTTITVSAGLPNGGTLYSPTPTELRSFEVLDGGTGAWLSTTFTAAIVGNTVVLTKTVPGTPWLTGTQVRYLSGLQNRNDNDGATEDLIINAALYETWNKEVIGRGMPVLGSLSGGKWFPDWSVTVSG